MRSIDRIYYEYRFVEEMDLGDLASEATVAAVHFELAHRYSLLVAQIGAGKPRLTLVQNEPECLAA